VNKTTSPATLRLFVALDIDDQTRQRLRETITKLKTRDVEGSFKWVDSRNIHLTLKFLGDTPQSMKGNIQSAVSRALMKAAITGALSPTIDSLGAFPNLGRPRIVWAGLGGVDCETIVELAGTIDAELSSLGYPRESRAFTPHVTLARARDGADTRAIAHALQSTQWKPHTTRIDTLALYSSELRPAGPVYTALTRWSFDKKDTDQ